MFVLLSFIDVRGVVVGGGTASAENSRRQRRCARKLLFPVHLLGAIFLWTSRLGSRIGQELRSGGERVLGDGGGPELSYAQI
jgi:hypothetical protein